MVWFSSANKILSDQRIFLFHSKLNSTLSHLVFLVHLLLFNFAAWFLVMFGVSCCLWPKQISTVYSLEKEYCFYGSVVQIPYFISVCSWGFFIIFELNPAIENNSNWAVALCHPFTTCKNESSHFVVQKTITDWRMKAIEMRQIVHPKQTAWTVSQSKANCSTSLKMNCEECKPLAIYLSIIYIRIGFCCFAR